ncbi:MAG: NAD-dependent epimerase/dehydratase family protein [Planctomycetes bacterium]|nr:NAD-dependent epimerase/dehydratase family protein [Planctomycetota bacterium]
MPPICFVTGASGFLARAFVPMLAPSYRLRLLVRDERRLPQFTGLEHEPVVGSLDDEAALRAGCSGADVVAHLAALVSFRPEDRARSFAVNEAGTARLAAIAREHGVRRFLHVSTISAIGYSDDRTLLDESSPYNFGPLGCGYCDSKFAAEQRVLDEVRRGLDAVIVNPPSMYGPGDRRKGDDSLLGAVFAGRVRFAPCGGLNVAAVDDVCHGMLAALARGRSGERYLLGGENLTGRELLARVAQVVGGAAPKRTVPRWLMRVAAAALAQKERMFGSRPPLTSEVLRLGAKFLWFSSDKAGRELGWRAGPVDRGIRAAWDELRAPT